MSKVFKKLQNEVKKLENITAIFKTDKGSGLITYADLKRYPFNEVQDLENGVSFYRKFHPKKEVYFIANMDPKKGVLIDGVLTAIFGKQWHDCKEIATVILGHLIETMPLEQNNTITVKGQQKVYDKLVIHKPGATMVSKYGVEFIDPNN